MAKKPIDLQHDMVMVDELETPDPNHVGFSAKADGLYQRRPGHAEERLLKEGDATGNSSIVIPVLKLKGLNFKTPETSYQVRDILKASWQAKDQEFLNYNPEIWLFRRNAYRKSIKRRPLLNNIELLPNGTFDNASEWTIETSSENLSSISGGVLHVSVNNSTKAAQSNTIFTTGKYYRVQFTASNYVSGKIICRFSEASMSTLICSGNGTFTGYLYAAIGSPGILRFEGYTDVPGLSAADIDNVSVKELDGVFYDVINKKWKHEPHMNGAKFPWSKYYAGKTSSPIASVDAEGRHTEWALTSGNGQYQVVDLNCYEFLHTTDLSGNILTDEFDFNNFPSIRFCNTKRWLELRFAIVIDNPDTESDNPKQIGPLSDVILLRIHKINLGGYFTWRFIYTNYDFWVRP